MSTSIDPEYVEYLERENERLTEELATAQSAAKVAVIPRPGSSPGAMHEACIVIDGIDTKWVAVDMKMWVEPDVGLSMHGQRRCGLKLAEVVVGM